MSNILDEFYVCMFRTLARSIFIPPPHKNFTHSVKYAVTLFKIPSLSSAHPIRQTSRQECLAFLVQQGQVTCVKVLLPAEHIPIQGLDQNLSHIIAGVNNQGNLIQLRVLVLGRSYDIGIEFINLKYVNNVSDLYTQYMTSIY